MQSIIASLNDTPAEAQSTRGERRLIRKYAAGLPEPQRTIFLHRQSGMLPHEIAKAMELTHEAVCRSLAKSYSQLRINLQA
jgi:DNA-directed RNA polymerase specialized sigma24 family protein